MCNNIVETDLMNSTLPITIPAKVLLKKEQSSGITTKSFFSQFPVQPHSLLRKN